MLTVRKDIDIYKRKKAHVECTEIVVIEKVSFHILYWKNKKDLFILGKECQPIALLS